jgi:60 kDa SS-A/Ro ribonucleoprotein
LAAQSATTVSEWERLIAEHRLSWEMLPDVALKEADVWRALINNGMPMGALIRQLPRLTNLGVLKGGHLTNVVTQLSSQEALTKARIHPVNVLTALRTYANGHGFQGSNTWTPNVKIIDALDSAFYASFGNVVPANKRTMNALDVSGSMDGWYFGSGQPKPWTPRDISVAMSLVTLATEPEVLSVAFQRTLTTLNLSSRQRLDDAINYVSRLSFGATDCSLPMLHAREKSLEIDTFVVWTDSETWAGRVQPFEALQQYRKASGIDARLIVCGVTATDFTIADPRDAGMLDVVGFDSAVPNLISDFSAGKI